MERRKFIEALAVTLGLSAGQAMGQTAATGDAPRRWKGRADSSVKRWDVITVGNLSRNRYWGESDAKAVRPVLCTCTLVVGDGFALLVDPSIKDGVEMAREFDRRTGKKPDFITACFVTHEHGDHWAGLENFPRARWLAAPLWPTRSTATPSFPSPSRGRRGGCWMHSTLSRRLATPQVTTRYVSTAKGARSQRPATPLQPTISSEIGVASTIPSISKRPLAAWINLPAWPTSSCPGMTTSSWSIKPTCRYRIALTRSHSDPTAPEVPFTVDAFFPAGSPPVCNASWNGLLGIDRKHRLQSNAEFDFIGFTRR